MQLTTPYVIEFRYRGTMVKASRTSPEAPDLYQQLITPSSDGLISYKQE